MDHEERADQLEHEVDKLEQHTEQVGKRIEDTRKEWESKQEDQQVPGAQAEEREESDQLPEEGPPSQVPDDETGAKRDDADENPGVPGEDEQGTGNPDAAGSEE